jgi:hypothetical protein
MPRSSSMNKNLRERFYEKFLVRPKTRCWIWIGSRNKRNYGQMSTRRGCSPVHASRVSWGLHYGEIPRGMFVLHRCDNPPCVNPEHLFVGNQKENVADMLRKRRGLVGQKNGQAKLNVDEVLAIREMSGKSQQQIAQQFGINQQQVSKIRLRKRWAHLV